jgi:SpoVK/Ycf46/Vps4 family AAA+-type ATPase
MSVKALVNEIKGDVVLHELKFKDIESMWVGESVQILKDYFRRFNEDAKNNHVIVFIDEIDAVLPKRTKHLCQTTAQRVNVFLEWLDGGIQSLQNISLIGATNCLKNIDETALRPGRYDRIIEFHPLPAQAIVEALKVHLNLK